MRWAAGLLFLVVVGTLAATAAIVCRRTAADDNVEAVPTRPPAAAVDVAVSLPPSTPTLAAPLMPRRREVPTPPVEQLVAYTASGAKSVLELQPYRRSASAAFEGGSATLVDLQPAVHAFFVLELAWDDGRRERYHLENADPAGCDIALAPAGEGLRIVSAEAGPELCRPWQGGEAAPLARARASGSAFAPLCRGRLWLRNETAGRKTRMEATTDLLRDSVPGGEAITALVRRTVYQDAFLETSELLPAAGPGAGRRRPAGAPLRPEIDPRYDGVELAPPGLGIRTGSEVPGRMLAGRWYRALGHEGVFVSVVQPALAAAEVAARQRGRVNALDEVESSALVYLVAFDLDAFELGFALGTDHPRVGWSERTPPVVRDDGWGGPDGIATAAPLVRTGQVAPFAAGRVTATFTGGFKRDHGAFKSGALAARNGASHYGFIEQGTIFSKLQPGLATVLVRDDGEVELRTWQREDDARLPRIRHARQNGVAILEPDPATGETAVGALVRAWGDGNWSGSQDRKLRTVRGGLCLQDSDEGRFLIYAYFSSGTPSAMARVLDAYRCGYAMLLDMNALEHTYLALLAGADADAPPVQHLIDGMAVLDRADPETGEPLPRFVAFADNRDFFYLLRKEE